MRMKTETAKGLKLRAVRDNWMARVCLIPAEDAEIYIENYPDRYSYLPLNVIGLCEFKTEGSVWPWAELK